MTQSERTPSARGAHFIGIGGVGMTATAMLLKEQGWSISGTDPGCHPPSSTFLEKQGIQVHSEYGPENIPAGTRLVVAGGSAKVDPNLNDEVAAAHAREDITVRTFPEVLARITKETKNIVVAGSYAKSTCTALLAWILQESGLEPGYFIGAFSQQLESPGKLGAGKLFVLEGDEYPTSGLDSRSKFLHFRTDDLLVTSLEHDHVNIFKTQEDYVEPFEQLVRGVAPDGVVVACSDDPRMGRLLESAPCRTVTYGFDESTDPDWTAADVHLGKTSWFRLLRKGVEVTRIETALLGRHNIQNIVGCAALLLERELVEPSQLREAVASFRGIKRRLDLISGSASRVYAYEGFGSSHAKARAAIEAMRDHFGDLRLVTLFEPSAFSWRNRSKLHWYETVFEDSAVVMIFAPPTLGAGRHDQLSHSEILDVVRKRHPEARAIETAEEGLAALGEELRDGDVLLVLTSGDMGGLVPQLAGFIDQRFGDEGPPSSDASGVTGH